MSKLKDLSLLSISSLDGPVIPVGHNNPNMQVYYQGGFFSSIVNKFTSSGGKTENKSCSDWILPLATLSTSEQPIEKFALSESETREQNGATFDAVSRLLSSDFGRFANLREIKLCLRPRQTFDVKYLRATGDRYNILTHDEMPTVHFYFDLRDCYAEYTTVLDLLNPEHITSIDLGHNFSNVIPWLNARQTATSNSAQQKEELGNSPG